MNNPPLGRDAIEKAPTQGRNRRLALMRARIGTVIGTVIGTGAGRALTRLLRRFTLGIGVLGLAACATIVRDHGYVPTDRQLDEVIVGVDTRDSVPETLGRPSTGGILDDGGFYYVSSRFRHWAWTAPKEIDRQVVAISFDDKGVVSNVERFGLEGGRVVVLSRRITDSTLAGPTFIGQLFSNFGNVTAADVVN